MEVIYKIVGVFSPPRKTPAGFCAPLTRIPPSGFCAYSHYPRNSAPRVWTRRILRYTFGPQDSAPLPFLER